MVTCPSSLPLSLHPSCRVQRQVFRVPFSGLEPPGTYQWLAALTAAGTLNVIDLIGRVAQNPFTVVGS